MFSVNLWREFSAETLVTVKHKDVLVANLHIWAPAGPGPTASLHSSHRRWGPCRSGRKGHVVGSGSLQLWLGLQQCNMTSTKRKSEIKCLSYRKLWLFKHFNSSFQQMLSLDFIIFKYIYLIIEPNIVHINTQTMAHFPDKCLMGNPLKPETEMEIVH